MDIEIINIEEEDDNASWDSNSTDYGVDHGNEMIKSSVA